MASKEKRIGNKRVYVVSGILLGCIFAGGGFLGMYITLPESQTAAWYPVAGMVLVGIPWLFWLLTFTYSCFSFMVKDPANNNNKQQNLTKAASTASSAAAATTSAEPHVAGRVKFGATTVLGEEDDQDGHTVESRGREGEELYEESSTSSSTTNNEQSSFSIKSHESERPLTLSMSS